MSTTLEPITFYFRETNPAGESANLPAEEQDVLGYDEELGRYTVCFWDGGCWRDSRSFKFMGIVSKWSPLP